MRQVFNYKTNLFLKSKPLCNQTILLWISRFSLHNITFWSLIGQGYGGNHICAKSIHNIVIAPKAMVMLSVKNATNGVISGILEERV